MVVQEVDDGGTIKLALVVTVDFFLFVVVVEGVFTTFPTTFALVLFLDGGLVPTTVIGFVAAVVTVLLLLGDPSKIDFWKLALARRTTLTLLVLVLVVRLRDDAGGAEDDVCVLLLLLLLLALLL